MTEIEGLYSTLVTNCVFNAILAYTAIMLNVITIQALRKTSSLPKTLKTLLLSLAVSDLGVGLLGQPVYIAVLVMEIEQNTNSIAYNTVDYAFSTLSRLIFSFASFFGVVALTVDRFLAIHLHLRYQELVTHKRVVAVVILLWVLSVSISFLHLYSIINKYFKFIVTTISVVCFVTPGLLYCKIYAVIRHHTNQIHALHVQQATQNEEMTNAARLRKTAVGTFYVYIVFLVCYLPIACAGSAKNYGKTALISHLIYFARTLVFLNSSLNPLIYCWKMRHIRQAVIDIPRTICPSGH